MPKELLFGIKYLRIATQGNLKEEEYGINVGCGMPSKKGEGEEEEEEEDEIWGAQT